MCGPSRHISGSYTTVHNAKHISYRSYERAGYTDWNDAQHSRLPRSTADKNKQSQAHTQTLFGQNTVVNFL